MNARLVARAMGVKRQGVITSMRSHDLVEQLATLVKAKDSQEALNNENLSSCLNTLETVIRGLGLKEEVWVEAEIPDLTTQVLGWSEGSGEWHLVLANRESCPDPDTGETVVYGGSERRVVDCTPFEQRCAFEELESLIEAIHHHLKSRYGESRKRGDEIIRRIRELDQLLKGWTS